MIIIDKKKNEVVELILEMLGKDLPQGLTPNDMKFEEEIELTLERKYPVYEMYHKVKPFITESSETGGFMYLFAWGYSEETTLKITYENLQGNITTNNFKIKLYSENLVVLGTKDANAAEDPVILDAVPDEYLFSVEIGKIKEVKTFEEEFAPAHFIIEYPQLIEFLQEKFNLIESIGFYLNEVGDTIIVHDCEKDNLPHHYQCYIKENIDPLILWAIKNQQLMELIVVDNVSEEKKCYLCEFLELSESEYKIKAYAILTENNSIVLDEPSEQNNFNKFDIEIDNVVTLQLSTTTL